MKKDNVSKIPTLNPFQLDDYLFTGRMSPNDGWYSNFHIERIENYKDRLKLPIPPHRRSVFFFVFLTAGRVVRSKLLNNYEILPGHFFFLPADMTTSLEFVADDTAGFYCHFVPEIFQHPQLKIDLAHDFPFFTMTATPVLKAVDPARIGQMLQILYEENLQHDKVRFELVVMYLLALFAEVKHQNLSQPNLRSAKNAATFLTERYQHALSEWIYEKTSVAEYAELLNVSPNHLHKCVKSATAKSAHDLLAEMRVLEAKVLLKQSNLSIGEIAYKIGKFDQSDFSRFFKTKTGLTPNQYRQGGF